MRAILVIAALMLVTSAVMAAPPADRLQSFVEIDARLGRVLRNGGTLLRSYVMRYAEARTTRRVPGKKEITLPDLYIDLGEDTAVTLKNLQVTPVPHVRLTEAVMDLQYLNMAVEGSLGDLHITGDLITSSKTPGKSSTKPVAGKISIDMKSVGMKGKTGLRLVEDSILSSNYDLRFTPETSVVSVVLRTPRETGSKSSWEQTLENIVVEKLQKNLNVQLSKKVKLQLDDILCEQSLRELLEGDRSLVDSYRSHARLITTNANEYVDEVLKKVQQKITDTNSEQLGIDAILEASFSDEVLWVTWHGSFTANQAWARNLATLQRTSDVSLSYENGAITVFGSIGLGELQLGFDYYHVEFMDIGPSGSIKASVGGNSVFVSATINFLSAPLVTLNDIHVEEISDISLDITGLGILDWLVSSIATWILGFFNDDVVSLVDGKLNTFVSDALNSVDASQFFH